MKSMLREKKLRNRITRERKNNFEVLLYQFKRPVVMQAFFIEVVVFPLKNPFQEKPIPSA